MDPAVRTVLTSTSEVIPEDKYYTFPNGAAFLRTSRIKFVRYENDRGNCQLLIDFWPTKKMRQRRLTVFMGYNPDDKEKRKELIESIKSEVKKLCETFYYLYMVLDMYAFDSKRLTVEMVSKYPGLEVRFVDELQVLNIFGCGGMDYAAYKTRADHTAAALLKL